jgi:hypothetical protein
MRTHTKLHAGEESELTRLKLLWRDSLAEDAKDYWLSVFVSPDSTRPQIRAMIATELKINLRYDSQLYRFQQWELEQRAQDLEAERQNDDERRIKAEFGDWDLDQVREEVLKRSYARALAIGDFDAGRKTIKQDMSVQKTSMDERKLVLLEQKAAQADAAKEVIKSKLTPEEQRRRLKEILK